MEQTNKLNFNKLNFEQYSTYDIIDSISFRCFFSAYSKKNTFLRKTNGIREISIASLIINPKPGQNTTSLIAQSPISFLESFLNDKIKNDPQQVRNLDLNTFKQWITNALKDHENELIDYLARAVSSLICSLFITVHQFVTFSRMQDVINSKNGDLKTKRKEYVLWFNHKYFKSRLIFNIDAYLKAIRSHKKLFLNNIEYKTSFLDTLAQSMLKPEKEEKEEK